MCPKGEHRLWSTPRNHPEMLTSRPRAGALNCEPISTALAAIPLQRESTDKWRKNILHPYNPTEKYSYLGSELEHGTIAHFLYAFIYDGVPLCEWPPHFPTLTMKMVETVANRKVTTLYTLTCMGHSECAVEEDNYTSAIDETYQGMFTYFRTHEQVCKSLHHQMATFLDEVREDEITKTPVQRLAELTNAFPGLSMKTEVLEGRGPPHNRIHEVLTKVHLPEGKWFEGKASGQQVQTARHVAAGLILEKIRTQEMPKE